MIPLLETLLGLQQLDDRLFLLGDKRTQIPVHMQSLEEAFEEEKLEFEREKQRRQEAVLRQRQLEKQLQESSEDRKKKQSRLLEVKTNEEYRAQLKEIEYTRQADSQTEDEILMLLEEVDTLEKTIGKKESSMQEKAKQLQEDLKRLEQEIVDNEREYEMTHRERSRLCEEIDRDVLSDYELLRTRRSGQAVVTVHREVCPGCNMRIPPQTINEVLQTGEIRHCPNCRRILYCELEDTAQGG